MAATRDARTVKKLVVDQLVALGANVAELAALEEMILIQQGSYRGRSYRTPRLFAMWMVEADMVQFYAEDGTPLTNLSLAHPPQAIRRAD